MKNVKLVSENIGDGFPCYFIAEIGNLFKNFEEAKRLIDSAKKIGINAVKFQTWDIETFTTKNNFFDFEATGHVSQYELHKSLQISANLQHQVVDYAKKNNVTIFSAPSHIKDIKLMEELDVPIYKIGSDLACHIPLLKEVAKLDKPIILSTGMCTLEEVRNSVNAILSTGNEQLAILHCVADYPTKPEETNLSVISTLKKEFDLPVGLSDHNIDPVIAIGAASMGANLIEKHFRDTQNSSSPDDIVALDKDEFRKMIESVRLIERARGDGKKNPTESEKINLLTNRVSIVSMVEIKAGQTITENLIDIRRPGTGIQPIHFDEIIGKKARINISKEEPVTFDMIK
jgi:N,N'-diacetyllegionaminate synthase